MPRDSGTGALAARLTGFTAKHPRLVLTLVLLLALVAAQGSVAAAVDVDFGGSVVDTSGSGSVDDGP